MEKNTTLFNSLIDEFFNMLNEADLEETKQSKDKCKEDCHCEHCHDEKDDEYTQYTPNIKVLSYTDEDFKDKEKLEEYVDEIEKLMLVIENMSNDEMTALSFIYQNDNIPEYLEGRIDHAYDVYNTSVKEHEKQMRKDEESKKREEQNKLGINKLASRYVDEVFTPTLNKGGITLPKSQIIALKRSFGDFAKWILNQ